MELIKGLHAFIWRNFQVNNCNTYLITGSKNVLIDPGLFQVFGNVRGELLSLGLRLNQIDLVLITHGHFDHLESAGEFEGMAPIAMSFREYEFLRTSSGIFGGSIEPDLFLEEGDLALGDVNLKIIPAPGHSPGSLCIYWPERKALFSGDVVFENGIGRTDLPGGDGGLLKETIERIAALEIDYLLPGHGEIVAGRKKVKNNFESIEKTWFPYLSERPD